VIKPSEDEDFDNACEISFAEKLRETNERLDRQQKQIMRQDYSNTTDLTKQLDEYDKNKTINLKEIADQIELCQNNVQKTNLNLSKEKSAKSKKKERLSTSNKSKNKSKICD